jgi:radical SAM superfamily enzyme YgiQ (UPF0313 family)
MNIQLFLTPSFYYGDMRFKMLPTLGLPILAAVLNKAGHHTEVVDLEAHGVGPQRLADAFRKQAKSWPDVVGFGGLDVAEQGMGDCIKAVRAAGFQGRIIVGGAFITHSPEKGIEMGADLAVTGEAEGNIVELLESGATGIHAGKAVPIEDVPAPDWDHFSPDIATYYGNMAMMRPHPGVTMWTRGCPYNCIFCANVVYKHSPTRYRPPENIEAEMKDLWRRGSRQIYVYDDELVGTKMPPGWIEEVADRVGPMGFESVTQGRCSKKFVTPELMAEVKRTGIHTVFYGVESFSEKVLKAINKRTDQEDIWHTLRATKEAGVKNGLFMMIGNYQETEEDLAITADHMGRAYKEGLVDYCQTTVCTVMQGTEYENIQKREGWYIRPTFAGRDLRAPVKTPWLSERQIEYWQRKLWEVCPVGIPI